MLSDKQALKHAALSNVAAINEEARMLHGSVLHLELTVKAGLHEILLME